MMPEEFSPEENEKARRVYRALIDSQFAFLHEPMSLKEIYVAVKEKWPELCSDNYLCKQNCKAGGSDPEWKHQVRSAINTLKKKGILQRNEHSKYCL